jgi:hypothetical protein
MSSVCVVKGSACHVMSPRPMARSSARLWSGVPVSRWSQISQAPVVQMKAGSSGFSAWKCSPVAMACGMN